MNSTSDISRIAMWSGPRNISTAMMRSWGARPDTVVCDEPLYAVYLDRTGHEHPGRDDILSHHETSLDRVIADLTGPVDAGTRIYYQKHMAHHLLPDMPRDWIDALTSVFLIRSPAEMLTSLTRVLPDITVDETGLPQQVELFDRLRDRTGRVPVVLDARDVLIDPGVMLERLCDLLHIPWDPTMLSWEPGPRTTDGVWARHWYANVEASTGFAPFTPRPQTVPDHLSDLLAACLPLYDHLHAHRLTVD